MLQQGQSTSLLRAEVSCHPIGCQGKGQHPIKACIAGISAPQRKANHLAKNVQIAVSNTRSKGVMNNHLGSSIASQLAQMLQPGAPSTQKRQGHHLVAMLAQSLSNPRHIDAHMAAWSQ